MALYYNGIEFVDVNTTTHITGPVKDPSGSDQLYTRITIKARTILNIQYLPATVADANGDAGAILARVRHYLTQPRAPMYYDISSPPGPAGRIFGAGNGQALINLPGGRDDANGPWPDPEAISVVYTTPETLEIQWACTVHLLDCNQESLFNGSQNPISIRWEDSLTWDETWRATFQRQGVCIIGSRGRYTIDWFRRYRINLIVPAGFRRTGAKYLVSKDGLRCDFTFTDTQIRFAPPMPAVKMKIVQSETAPTQGGMKKGAVSVELVGLQNANVRDLANWALIIMKARVWASNKLIFQGIVPGVMNLQTTETQDDVSVQATCSYKVNPSNQRQTSTIAAKKNWGTIIAGSVVAGPFLAVPVLAGGALLTPSADKQPTQQVTDPISNSPWPWVGYGTSPTSPENPIGFAPWANPYASIQPPNQGVGMSEAVSLFAALLQDPCGRGLQPVPNQLDAPPVIQIPGSSIITSSAPLPNTGPTGSMWNGPDQIQNTPGTTGGAGFGGGPLDGGAEYPSYEGGPVNIGPGVPGGSTPLTPPRPGTGSNFIDPITGESGGSLL